MEGENFVPICGAGVMLETPLPPTDLGQELCGVMELPH